MWTQHTHKSDVGGVRARSTPGHCGRGTLPTHTHTCMHQIPTAYTYMPMTMSPTGQTIPLMTPRSTTLRLHIPHHDTFFVSLRGCGAGGGASAGGSMSTGCSTKAVMRSSLSNGAAACSPVTSSYDSCCKMRASHHSTSGMGSGRAVASSVCRGGVVSKVVCGGV